MSNYQDDPQVQKLLQNYHEMALALREAKSASAAEEAIAPIASQSDETQVAFLKSLTLEATTDAADIATAIRLTTSNEAVRREARKLLIKLENKDIYPVWSESSVEDSTAVMSLSEVMDQTLAGTLPIPEGVDASLFSELQSLLSEAKGLLGNSEHEETVSSFVEAWSAGDYENAYELLASNSPLREGLSIEDWVTRRNQWQEQAKPQNSKITFAHTIEAAENAEDSQATVQQAVAEIGWSLEYTDVPALQNAAYPELPVATAVFKETGRHWFWTSYTLVEEDGEWLIDTMTDEGEKALHLPPAELSQRIDEIIAIASQRIEEDEDDDDDDDDLDVVEALDADELHTTIDADEDDDDDLYDADEDDDDDDDDFEETFARMDEAVRITVQAMHYNDGLIAQQPQANPDIYRQAFAQATGVNEPERAAVYLQQLATQFPEQRGEALRELAFVYNTITDSYDEEDEEEHFERFRALTEQTLREAIATDNAPAAYIMLADLLIEDDEQLDEAKKLLRKAQTLTTDESETILIHAGLAEIAQLKDQFEIALKHYQSVAEKAPDFPNIWFHIGSLYHQLGQHSDAISYLRRSIETTPDLVEAYAELGAIQLEEHEVTLARDTFKQGLAIDPESVDLLAMVSLAYLQNNDLRNAGKYLDQAEELDEEHQLVQVARSAYNQLKKQQRANPIPKGHSKNQSHKKKK